MPVSYDWPAKFEEVVGALLVEQVEQELEDHLHAPAVRCVEHGRAEQDPRPCAPSEQGRRRRRRRERTGVGVRVSVWVRSGGEDTDDETEPKKERAEVPAAARGTSCWGRIALCVRGWAPGYRTQGLLWVASTWPGHATRGVGFGSTLSHELPPSLSSAWRLCSGGGAPSLLAATTLPKPSSIRLVWQMCGRLTTAAAMVMGGRRETRAQPGNNKGASTADGRGSPARVRYRRGHRRL